MHLYSGNYSRFEQTRAQHLALQQQLYEKQQQKKPWTVISQAGLWGGTTPAKRGPKEYFNSSSVPYRLQKATMIAGSSDT